MVGFTEPSIVIADRECRDGFNPQGARIVTINPESRTADTLDGLVAA